jgi:hypothetical protein
MGSRWEEILERGFQEGGGRTRSSTWQAQAPDYELRYPLEVVAMRGAVIKAERKKSTLVGKV